jgi:pseudouridine kinase
VITVIGTVFVDIKGFANEKINSETKNTGTVEFMHGGVGRNVAETIARAGGQVEMISSVDNSALGEEVIARLQSLNVRANRMLQTDRGMGMWLAAIDGTGDLAASVSQKPDLGALEQLLHEHGEDIIKNSKAVALEFDLSDEIIQKIFGWAKKHEVPLYGIVGSCDIILSRLWLIDNLDMLICNKGEAELFLNTKLDTKEDCIAAARRLTINGLKLAVVTMGEQGSVYFDSRTEASGHVPCQSVAEVVDTTGAGDSFFSGTVFGLTNGYDIERSLQCGSQLAAWTIGSREAVDPTIQEKVKNHPLFEREAVLY